MRWNRFLLFGGVCLLLLTSCGDSDDGDSAANDLDGVSITVGSKDFTEQLVLGEIISQAMTERGAEVVRKLDTGDTTQTRAALEGGDIDTYFEYNSTGWIVHLGNSDPESDGEALTEMVADADSANGVTWVGRSTFNNTYGFAATPEIRQANLATRENFGEAFDLADMADYLKDNDDAVVCLEQDFLERADGMVLFEDATEYEVPDSQIVVVDTIADVYEEVADGACDFGEVFTTDGLLESLGLTPVVDPGVFFVYNVSLTIDSDVYNQAPDAFDDVVGDVLAPLSQPVITKLNQRVAEGEPVEDVAADFLDSFDVNP